MVNRNKTFRCPECEALLTAPKKRGGGYGCPTYGCDVHKVWVENGVIVRVLTSSVPREIPLTHIIFNEVN